MKLRYEMLWANLDQRRKDLVRRCSESMFFGASTMPYTHSILVSECDEGRKVCPSTRLWCWLALLFLEEWDHVGIAGVMLRDTCWQATPCLRTPKRRKKKRTRSEHSRTHIRFLWSWSRKTLRYVTWIPDHVRICSNDIADGLSKMSLSGINLQLLPSLHRGFILNQDWSQLLEQMVIIVS